MKALLFSMFGFAGTLAAQEAKGSVPFSLPAESRILLREFLDNSGAFPVPKASTAFRALYVDMADRLLLDDAKFKIERSSPFAHVRWFAKGVIRDEWLPPEIQSLPATYLKDVRGDRLADWERIEFTKNGVHFRIDSEWDRVFIVAYRLDANANAGIQDAVSEFQKKIFHFPPKEMEGQTGLWWSSTEKPKKGLQQSHFKLSFEGQLKELRFAELHGPFPEEANKGAPLRIDSVSSWKTSSPVLSDGRFFAILVSYWEQGHLGTRTTSILGTPDRW